jgi:hypothetical protein
MGLSVLENIIQKFLILEGIVSRGDQKSRGILFIMLGQKVVVLMVGMKLLNTIHGLNVLKNLELILSYAWNDSNEVPSSLGSY